jgi:O-antigen/teichoic acid export membrane protein
MKKNIKGTFYKDSSIYLTGSLITAGIGLALLPFYTRHLSPSDYGIVGLFLMFGEVSVGLLSMGLQSASYRYYFKYKDDIAVFKSMNSSILIFNIFTYALSFVGIYFLANWFSSNIFDDKLTGKLIIFSFISGCMEYFITYFSYLLIAQLRSISYTVITTTRSVLTVILAVYFILNYSLTFMALINAIMLTQVIVIICLIPLTVNLFSLNFSFTNLKQPFNYSYPMVLRMMIGAIHGSFSKIILTNFTGLTHVGYYVLSEKIGGTLKLIKDAIDKSWYAFFMEKVKENTKDSKKSIETRYFEISFLLMLFGFGIICFSEELIKLLTTKDYYIAMYVIPIFVLYNIIGIINSLTIPQINYSEKNKYILPASIINVIINISLNILLIPIYGVFGAISALIIAHFLGSMSHLYFGFKVCPLPLNKWKIIGIFFYTLLFTFPIYIIMMTDIHFLLKILIKFAIFLLFVLFGNLAKYISFKKIIIYANDKFPKLSLLF